MPDEALLAVLGEAEAQALRLAAVGLVLPSEHRDGRHLRHDVLPELVPAHPALRADATVRAVRHSNALQRLLQVRLEPPLLDARVDVVPRQRRVQALVGERAAVDAPLAPLALPAIGGVAQLGQHVPLSISRLSVLPSQPGFLDGLVERLEGGVLAVPPRVLVRAQLPGPANHVAECPVAAPDEVLHRGDAHGREVRLDSLHLLNSLLQQLPLPFELVR
mmetsp:Transcript_11804/g.28602  ORF Transcript_11804/g.28602 Transcript_11804/m.28602 type:complete len:219 (+) Transcript_11804:1191-1847(+)